jgi:DNA-binding NarL/FixJ family response regulator
MTTRVVVADDQALVRAGFRLLVDSAPDLEVVGETADGAQAVELALREQPDVVLMDIRMPVLDGLGATRQISALDETTAVRILVLTTFDLDEYVYEALRAGASGFVLKDIPPADLLTAIRVVAAGDALLAPSVTRRLIAQYARRPGPTPVSTATLGVLTDREREVLVLVARGLSKRRDRRTPGGQPGDLEDPRQPAAHQTRRPGPGAAGGGRLRGRPGHPRPPLNCAPAG